MWTAPLKGAFRFQFTVLSYLAVSCSKTMLFFVSVPSSPGPLFQNEGRCSAFDMEIIFHSQANKTHFHKKVCAPSLILKVRVFGTRNWPIRNEISYLICRKNCSNDCISQVRNCFTCTNVGHVFIVILCLFFQTVLLVVSSRHCGRPFKT